MMVSDNEVTQGKHKSLELSALPKLIVPTTENVDATTFDTFDSISITQPHALSVDFPCGKGEAVSPCSEFSPSSRCSVVSLSPSLFPLPPPMVPTPMTSTHSVRLDSPPGTSRSQTSVTSWFSPPSPPPCTPLPPTPTQRKLASLIASKEGLESLQPPANIKVKSPYSSPCSVRRDSDVPFPQDTPMTPPRRSITRVIDTRGNRESAVDPDAPLSPPRSSLPPPYSPSLCTTERLSNASMANSSRVNSTTPMLYRPISNDAAPHNPAPEHEGRKKSGDLEAGGAQNNWQTKPKKRKRKIMMAVVGAASAALLMVIAGVAVGVWLAVSGSTSL
ncbi:hypothetical protein F4819DRAFT_274517 [Hypoxylon fuscum]|nr:hypothetical protein F4819DRAFT_274517 [Hypoxylon fuscum]